MTRLVNAAAGDARSADGPSLVERLFAALPVESQERIVRELLSASVETGGAGRIASPVAAEAPRPRRGRGPMSRRGDLPFRDIGPWRTCCRMMADIDRAPTVADVESELPAEVFAALGDETRLKIIRLLQDEDRRFEQIARALGVPRSTLSHHLRVLREAGLIQVERQGRTRVYSLAQPQEAP